MGSARAAWASRSRTEAVGVCDMEPLFDSGVFRALRDERLFRLVHVPLLKSGFFSQLGVAKNVRL